MTKVGVFLAKIVAIVNQKGGVGKTTTCVNLTSSLKEKGNRVLLCDFDPQANSTSGMGVDKAASRGVYDVLINGADVTASVAHTRYGDVLPSSKALAGAGIEMIDRENREFLLKQALDILSPNYDFILIDCPPSLGLLTVNALTAADYLLIPTMAETFAASGITQLYDTYRSVKKYTNPALRIDGVLLTRTERTRVTKTIQELTGKIAEYMGADVYRTTIRSNVIIKEAQAAQENVFDYVEGKSQTKGERVTESSRNFVGDCLAFVKEFVEKEREQ